MTSWKGPAARVSVLIPAYNSAAYLKAALDSVFAQTYTDFEVLVVDDGSTDHTRDVVAPYLDRIQYEYQENAGIGNTRNVAMRLARGEYLAFLDSDDVWEPDNLATKISVLDRFSELGAVFSDFYVIDATGAVLTSEGTTAQFKVFHHSAMRIEGAFQGSGAIQSNGRTVPVWIGEIFDTLFLGNFILPTSCVMRREAAHEVGPFRDMRSQEDYEYFLRFARSHQIGFVPEPLVRYRRHADQLTTFDRIESVVHAANEIIGSYECDFTRRGQRKVFDRRKADLCATMGAVHVRQGHGSAARSIAAEAIKRAPGNWRGYAVFALSLVPHRALAALSRW